MGEQIRVEGNVCPRRLSVCVSLWTGNTILERWLVLVDKNLGWRVPQLSRSVSVRQEIVSA